MRNIARGTIAALTLTLASAALPASSMDSMSGSMSGHSMMKAPTCSASHGPVVWYNKHSKIYHMKGTPRYEKGEGMLVCRSTAMSMGGKPAMMSHGSAMSHHSGAMSGGHMSGGSMSSPHPMMSGGHMSGGSMSGGSMSGGSMSSPHPMMSGANGSTSNGSMTNGASANGVNSGGAQSSGSQSMPVAPGGGNAGGSGAGSIPANNPAATPQPKKTP